MSFKTEMNAHGVRDLDLCWFHETCRIDERHVGLPWRYLIATTAVGVAMN